MRRPLEMMGPFQSHDSFGTTAYLIAENADGQVFRRDMHFSDSLRHGSPSDFRNEFEYEVDKNRKIMVSLIEAAEKEWEMRQANPVQPVPLGELKDSLQQGSHERVLEFVKNPAPHVIRNIDTMVDPSWIDPSWGATGMATAVMGEWPGRVFTVDGLPREDLMGFVSRVDPWRSPFITTNVTIKYMDWGGW
jgi:hypothetical protein